MSWQYQPLVPAAADLTSTPVETAGYVYVWLEAEWVQKPIKMWTGEEWVIKPLKIYDGSWNPT